MNKTLIFHIGYIAVGIVLFLIEIQLYEIVSLQIQFRNAYGDTPGYPYFMLLASPLLFWSWALLIGIPLVYGGLYSVLGIQLHKKGYITHVPVIDWFLIVSPAAFVVLLLVAYLFIWFGIG